MSTFCGIIDEIPNISVDRFDGKNKSSSAYFLSHCHSDHMRGLFDEEFIDRLDKNEHIYLYCSEISYHILMNTAINRVKDSVKIVSYRMEVLVEVPPSEKYPSSQSLSVTVIPAGHCPGSVMFLFENHTYRILYTGDIRLAEGDIRKMRQLMAYDGNVKHFDALYLDTTFLSGMYNYFPPRRVSANVLCELISEWLILSPEHFIHIITPAIHGSEYLFSHIFKTLKYKIHVNFEHFDLYRNVPEVESAITASACMTQVHACKNKCPILEEKIKEGVVRFIKPSALWYKNAKEGDKIFLDGNSKNNFKVAYSSHSSLSELTDILDFLRPQKIVPCVVPPYCTEQDIRKTINKYGLLNVSGSEEKRKLDKPESSDITNQFSEESDLVGTKLIKNNELLSPSKKKSRLL